jgi:hypothetical protein
MLQFVFSGGPNTIATTLGFQSAPNAFCCAIKHSGRFCHAVEQCLNLQAKLDIKSDREKIGWLLQPSMTRQGKAMSGLSNHEFHQIRSLMNNKQKCSTSQPFAFSAINSFILSILSILSFFHRFYLLLIISFRFLMFDHSTTDTSSIFQNFIYYQVLCLFCFSCALFKFLLVDALSDAF